MRIPFSASRRGLRRALASFIRPRVALFDPLQPEVLSSLTLAHSADRSGSTFNRSGESNLILTQMGARGEFIFNITGGSALEIEQLAERQKFAAATASSPI